MGYIRHITEPDTSLEIGASGSRLLIAFATQERSPTNLDSDPPEFNGVSMHEGVLADGTNTSCAIWYLVDSELPAAGSYTFAPPADNRGYVCLYAEGMDQDPATNAIFGEVVDPGVSPSTVDLTGAASTDLQVVVAVHTTNSAAFTVDTAGFTDALSESSSGTESLGAYKDGSVGTGIQVSLSGFETTAHQIAGASFPAAGASVGPLRRRRSAANIDPRLLGAGAIVAATTHVKNRRGFLASLAAWPFLLK